MPSPVPDCVVWMPCKEGDQPRPAPALLTPGEVIQLLRLDVSGNRNPMRTLEYYRAEGLLLGTKVGRSYVYPLSSVWKFIQHRMREA